MQEGRSVPPSPHLVESMREVGYSAPSAAADLIDNSISAGAHNVWILNATAQIRTDSYVAFADDGAGMSEASLVEAMRLGSKDPRRPLAGGELGRFGLGLKTASMSQARRVAVWTKVAGMPFAIRQWDLDRINEGEGWQLFSTLEVGSDQRNLEKILESTGLATAASGTIVMWSNLDHFLEYAGTSSNEQPQLDFGEASRDEQLMARKIQETLEHSSKVFHRFLTPQDENQARLTITKLYADGASYAVEAWDPFLETSKYSSLKTQLGEDTKILRKQPGEAIVRPIVLPHRDHVSDETWAMLGRGSSHIGLQGFYVYREERLIHFGGWLNLGSDFTQDDLYKLIRIAIFLKNSGDSQWRISVDKARVQIPEAATTVLTQIAREYRRKAAQVYRGPKAGPTAGRKGQGKNPSQAAPDAIWKVVRSSTEGRTLTSFRINQAHPLVKAAKKDPSALRALVGAIEDGIPFSEIRFVMSEGGGWEVGKVDVNAALDHLNMAVSSLARPDEKPCETLHRIATSIEPFTSSEYRQPVALLQETLGCKRRSSDD